MSRLNVEMAENLAMKMRLMLNCSMTEPLNAKTILRLLGILTMYMPLSDRLYGLSMKSVDGKCSFMLVNSNSTRGRQHFTIAHELYHLFYDDDPQPHFCASGVSDESERSANLFAGALLMPRLGLLQNIPSSELASGRLSLTTLLTLEALYGVSHSTLLIRLKELKLISKNDYDRYSALKIMHEALLRGFSTDVYEKGNEGLVIGDFGAKARELYDREIISEGHYIELLNMIGYGGRGEDSADCVGC